MLSKLILGTVQFGLVYGINNKTGLLSRKEVNEILNRASVLGIETLDTAAAYGEAEERLGSYHLKNGNVFNIISKFSKTSNEDWFLSLSRSLEKLQIDCLETVMFHSFDAYLENKESLGEILKLKNQKFNKMGVSVYTNSELNALIEEERVDVIQVPFNMLDNKQQRGEILKKLKASGKEIHTRSCFLQGLFFMDFQKLPEQLQNLKPHLNNIRKIAVKNGLEIGHLAMQYVLSKSYIDGVLFGVDSINQLEQNVNWTNELISKDILNQIDEINVLDNNLLNPSRW